METLLITGGAGFIGSNFVRLVLSEAAETDTRAVVLDKLTYAGSLESLADLLADPRLVAQKLIRLMHLNAVEARPLPIYGDGGHVRDWLYVEDYCRGILAVLRHGRPGGKYNLGARSERTNLQVVETLCDLLEEALPAAANPALAAHGKTGYRDLKSFVADRPGHDRRYAIDDAKIRRELGWEPRHDFTAGMRATVRWYLANRSWCDAVQSGRYGRERLGLIRS